MEGGLPPEKRSQAKLIMIIEAKTFAKTSRSFASSLSTATTPFSHESADHNACRNAGADSYGDVSQCHAERRSDSGAYGDACANKFWIIFIWGCGHYLFSSFYA
jgi:hypothetical protein